MLSVNFSYVCFIFAEIVEKMSFGGLEVSFSIVTFLSINLFNDEERRKETTALRIQANA